jgi:hypothetical protein
MESISQKYGIGLTQIIAPRIVWAKSKPIVPPRVAEMPIRASIAAAHCLGRTSQSGGPMSS